MHLRNIFSCALFLLWNTYNMKVRNIFIIWVFDDSQWKYSKQISYDLITNFTNLVLILLQLFTDKSATKNSVSAIWDLYPRVIALSWFREKHLVNINWVEGCRHNGNERKYYRCLHSLEYICEKQFSEKRRNITWKCSNSNLKNAILKSSVILCTLIKENQIKIPNCNKQSSKLYEFQNSRAF